MNAKATPANKPTPTRAGLTPAQARFQLAIAIVRADHELTPELMDEIEAIMRKLEKHK